MRRPHSWGPGELLAHEEGDGTVAAKADLPSHRKRGTEEGPKPSAPSFRCPRLEPYDERLSRTVCAVRRVITSPAQSGSTRRKCLGYQLTCGRKANGTRACWEKGATAGRRCTAGRVRPGRHGEG